MNDLKRYEHSVAWHTETLPLLREALWNLRTAHDSCPIGPETKKLAVAVQAAHRAVRECERNLAVARRLATKERERQERASA